MDFPTVCFFQGHTITKRYIDERDNKPTAPYTHCGSCDCAIIEAEKSPSVIVFQLVLGRGVLFHGIRFLLSVWSLCRQPVTFGLKYIMVTHPQFANFAI